MRFEATMGARTAAVEVRARDGRYTVVVDGRTVELELVRADSALWTVVTDGRRLEAGVSRQGGAYAITLGSRTVDVSLEDGAASAAGPHPRSGPARVTAPMPGRIVRVLVSPGDAVRAGQGLLVMEAMKMENEIRAPRDGRVRDIAVAERQAVETGGLLATLDALDA